MAKEKKEKVVIRKCHYCKKPLDEGKDFCLHCGHTYTEEDPFANEKKAKRKKFWIKSAIKAGIVLGILLVIAIAVFFIVKAITKSDFSKVIEFIQEEGEFIEAPVPDEEESVEGEESSTDEESSEESSSESESSTDEESSVDSETEGESTEGEQTSEEELPPRRVTLPDDYNRYVYELTEGYYLCCLEDATDTFYLIYEVEAEGLYNRIVMEINESTPTEALWEYRMSYTGDNVVDSRYDFDYTYYGTFDPSTFTATDEQGAWSVEIVTQIKEEVEEETPEEDLEGENPDEEESSSDEEESSSEEESSEEESSEDESVDEDGEPEEPTITPEQARENAAVKAVTIEVRRIVYYLGRCIELEGIGANFDGLGFVKYYNYLESLDPMNNPFKSLKK
ncbi:MAG: hypothetical protein E7622_04605 [Ruminococcaceae bacterium]|nr:hypothetical protein [Oscillospiraceae bacterium]